MQKKVYLTIDDSPSFDMKAKVDFLFERNIPALFFCRGDFMEARPSDTIYAIQKGFFIANHSYAHPHFSDISLAKAREEILRTDKVVDLVYRLAEVERPARYFRFPYGDKGDGRRGRVYDKKFFLQKKKAAAVQFFLRELGYSFPKLEGVNYSFFEAAGLQDDADWHWTFDIMEWALALPKSLPGFSSERAILERLSSKNPVDLLRRNQAKNYWLSAPEQSEIVLLHDHEDTTDLFYRIIEKMITLGIRFCDVAPLK